MSDPLSSSPVTTIDYRNARYQGNINRMGQRQKTGVLVDDDLSFYASHWKQNMLNGPSLVYIAHSKYIYGQWKNNEPHGLNVFRTGQAVLVANYNKGVLDGRMLVIFQRYSIIAILETIQYSEQYEVIECGKLTNHDDLLKYINILDDKMPDHYFSLIKFIGFMADSLQKDAFESDENLIASPCRNQNCYFGFREGLGIVFNSNNGVVSVGHHLDMELKGFGGKFDGKRIEEGNFDLNDTVSYHKKRPHNNIYAIFQKMHKRSLNFENQYFDSKIKTLGNLQTTVKKNINQIVNYNMKNKIHSATVQNLNDSLDYQQEMQEKDIQTIEQNRHNIYANEPKFQKKVISQYEAQQRHSAKKQVLQKKIVEKQVVESLSSSSRPYYNNSYEISKSTSKKQSKVSSCTQYQQQPNSNVPSYNKKVTQRSTNKQKERQNQQCVYYAKKSPIRHDNSSLKRKPKTPVNLKLDIDKIQESNQYRPCQFQRSASKGLPKNQQKPQQERKTLHQPIRRNSRPIDDIPKFTGLADDAHINYSPIKSRGYQHTQGYSKTQMSNTKTHRDQVQQYKKQLQRSRSKDRVQGKSISKVLKKPKYEDIQDRRKRILSQFKQLNQSQISVESKSSSKLSKDTLNKAIPSRSRHHQKSSINTEYDNLEEDNRNIKSGTSSHFVESPCQKNMISYTQNSEKQLYNQNGHENSAEQFIPLSLKNQIKYDPALRNNRRLVNLQNRVSYQQKQISSFTKKQSFIDKFEVSNSNKGSVYENSSQRSNFLNQSGNRKYPKRFNANNCQGSNNALNSESTLSKKDYPSIEDQEQCFGKIQIQRRISNKENQSRGISPLGGSKDVSRRKTNYKYLFDQ